MNIRGRISIASLYYYATPVFMLLDYVGGVSVRAAALDSMPSYKNLYYGFCIVCGVGVFALPWLAPVVALLESCVNILLTVLAVFLPYFHFVTETEDFLTATLPTTAGLDTPHVVNILLAGGIAIIGFHGSLRIMGMEGRRHPEFDQSL